MDPDTDKWNVTLKKGRMMDDWFVHWVKVKTDAPTLPLLLQLLPMLERLGKERCEPDLRGLLLRGWRKKKK